jgi:hypothetical protein
MWYSPQGWDTPGFSHGEEVTHRSPPVKGMGENSSLRRAADGRHRAPRADTRCGSMASCRTAVIMVRVERFVHAVPSCMEDAPAMMHTRHS